MTKIEWCDEVWNPVTGCSPISEGCDHCYAKRMAIRLKGRYGYPADDPFRVTFHSDRMKEPYPWPKTISGRKIFVCSMADLFHKDVESSWIRDIFKKIRYYRYNTFMVLTKRPELMKIHVDLWTDYDEILPNLWLGITAENQQRFDERWQIAQQIPASVLFVSGEPLLGGIDFSGYERKPDWFILGGETGPGARPMHPNWVRSVRDQCQEAGVPFFFKGWGEYYPYSDDCDAEDAGYYHERFMAMPKGTCRTVYRVGKKKAGALLDGRQWKEFPE